MSGKYEFQDYLFCNICNKDIDKHNETLLIEENIYCIYCDNWICGEYDAFGNLEEQ